MAAQDILLDENGDLSFLNGDFNVGPSDVQHMNLIVELFEGSIKQFPLQGVGISQYQASSGQAANIKRQISVKADADGFKNILVSLSAGIDGNYDYGVTADRP